MYIGLYKTPNKALSCLAHGCKRPETFPDFIGAEMSNHILLSLTAEEEITTYPYSIEDNKVSYRVWPIDTIAVIDGSKIYDSQEKEQRSKDKVC